MEKLTAVYCIHIEGSWDRKQHMDAFFREIGFTTPVYQFNGIIGSNVLNPRPKKHHLGHVGCVLSHMCLWYEIASKNSGSYLILEDDVGVLPEDTASDFEADLNRSIENLPPSVRMLHCTMDKSKKFHYKKSRFENSYKTVGSFNGKPIKKCSLVYPWATLTGAYIITPEAAKMMFRFAWFSIKNSWWLPLKPKRYNIDILMSRSIIASVYGAMGIILKQNININESGSDIKKVGSVNEVRKDIYVNRSFFRNSGEYISDWTYTNQDVVP